ncbi:MAG TPA: hypothetical protein PKG63_07680 [Bacteroidales bacterium]|nr:hypothetical protein [Bacteroidales bacterium]
MLKIESKIGTVRRSTDELFALLSNFENIVSFVPKDQVQDLVVEKERCTFTVQGQKMEIRHNGQNSGYFLDVLF